jgi:AcrR family transcriptional regulator
LPTKTAYHHGNLKPALITAARAEIAQYGIENFSLRRVARRAQVSAPAVYRHFADKDALIAAVAIDAATRLNDLIAECIRTAPPNPLEQFRAGGIAIVRFAAAHPEHFRVMSVPGVLAKAPSELLAGETSYLEGKRQMIRAAQEAGLMAHLPIDQIMLAANSLVVGLAHQIIEGRLGKVDDKRATELAKLVTQVFGVGILARNEDEHDPTVGVVIKGKKSRR